MKRFLFISAVVPFLVLCLHAGVHAQSPRRVIIDTDPGVDDAMAILLALNSPELKVEALTVVPGNVDGRQGLENALKLVSLAGRCDLAVASGARHPLNQKLITAQFWHGKNGLAGVELPESKCKADPRFGPDLIIELVHKYPHEITLIPVGPLTNIALAVSKDPSIVPLVKDIVIMGGSITGGNVNGAAEANIFSADVDHRRVDQARRPRRRSPGYRDERTLPQAPRRQHDGLHRRRGNLRPSGKGRGPFRRRRERDQQHRD